MQDPQLENQAVSTNGSEAESESKPFQGPELEAPDFQPLAQQFSEQLRSSDLWQEWSEAQEAFRTSEEAQQLIREYQLTLQEIEQELPPGEQQLNEEQISKIRAVEEKIQDNEVIQRRERAIGNLVQSFKQFSDNVAEELGLDLFKFAAQAKGSCGCEDGSCDC